MSTDPTAPDDETVQDPKTLQPGMLVVDREQAPDERDPAVVMANPPVEATDWEVTNLECTLAEDNPDYPEDARTILVIYRDRFEGDDEYTVEVPDEIRSKLANREPLPVGDIAALAKFYAFPAPRLEPTGEHWPSVEDDKPADVEDPRPAGDLDQLEAVVREAGFSGVQQIDDGVEVTKLGETYRIERSGKIVEGGAFADKLQAAIEEQYDP
jgi:hypothetical protein